MAQHVTVLSPSLNTCVQSLALDGRKGEPTPMTCLLISTHAPSPQMNELVTTFNAISAVMTTPSHLRCSMFEMLSLENAYSLIMGVL